MSLRASRESRDRTAVARRAVVRGAAWAVPVAAVAVASPALAVSPRCVAELEASGPGFSPQRDPSGTAFDYLWTDPFGDGSQVRLRVTSTQRGPGSINTADNLRWAGSLGSDRTYGAVPGADEALQFSVTTRNTFVATTYADYGFALEYKGPGASAFEPLPAGSISDLRFSITDFEGQRSTLPGTDHSAERGWLNGRSWTKTPTDPGYLLGAGTSSSPWRARTPANPADTNLVPNWEGAGTVTVEATAPVSSWLFTYALDTSGVGTPASGPITSNAWFAAPSFTVQQPGCG